MEKNNNTKINFIKHYVKPHRKKARLVTTDDINQVLQIGNILYNLCFTQHGMYGGGLAVAHPQIEKKNPMQLFVTKEKEIVINPVINRHVNYTINSTEGCLTFSDWEPIIVPRWHKMEATYQTLEDDKTTGNVILTDPITETISGSRARIWQHEIDHLNGIYCFDYNSEYKNKLPKK